MHSWFRSPSVESKKEIYAEKIVKTFLSFKKFFARISNTVNFKKSEFNFDHEISNTVNCKKSEFNFDHEILNTVKIFSIRVNCQNRNAL